MDDRSWDPRGQLTRETKHGDQHHDGAGQESRSREFLEAELVPERGEKDDREHVPGQDQGLAIPEGKDQAWDGGQSVHHYDPAADLRIRKPEPPRPRGGQDDAEHGDEEDDDWNGGAESRQWASEPPGTFGHKPSLTSWAAHRRAAFSVLSSPIGFTGIRLSPKPRSDLTLRRVWRPHSAQY